MEFLLLLFRKPHLRTSSNPSCTALATLCLQNLLFISQLVSESLCQLIFNISLISDNSTIDSAITLSHSKSYFKSIQRNPLLGAILKTEKK